MTTARRVTPPPQPGRVDRVPDRGERRQLALHHPDPAGEVGEEEPSGRQTGEGVEHFGVAGAAQHLRGRFELGRVVDDFEHRELGHARPYFRVDLRRVLLDRQHRRVVFPGEFLHGRHSLDDPRRGLQDPELFDHHQGELALTAERERLRERHRGGDDGLADNFAFHDRPFRGRVRQRQVVQRDYYEGSGRVDGAQGRVEQAAGVLMSRQTTQAAAQAAADRVVPGAGVQELDDVAQTAAEMGGAFHRFPDDGGFFRAGFDRAERAEGLHGGVDPHARGEDP
jgi:hypothetical protein